MQEWKDIHEYEGRYKINFKGEVYSYKTGKLKSLFYRKNVKNGSKRVGLNKNGKTKTYSIDRLLLETFPNKYISNKIKGEIWVDIKGFKSFYKVSNYGRVKSLNRFIPQNGTMRFMQGKILSNKRSNGNGYQTVNLSYGDEICAKNYYIHILVASNFITNKNNYKTVNHIDFNKSNNNVNNLEWMSHSQNNQHYQDNKENHYIDKNKKEIIKKMYLKNMSLEDMSNISNIPYVVVKQIINIYQRKIK